MKVFTIRIPTEEAAMIEQCIQGKNPSEKIRNYISMQLLNKDRAENLIKEYKVKIEYLEKYLKHNPLSDMYEQTEEEKKFFKETKHILSQPNGEQFLSGRCALYNNTFNRSVSIKEFKMMLK